jgi:uncharacterized protein DUF1573
MNWNDKPRNGSNGMQGLRRAFTSTSGSAVRILLVFGLLSLACAAGFDVWYPLIGEVIGPRADVNQERIDFGIVNLDQRQHARAILITNRGWTPLEVYRIEVPCHCLVTSPSGAFRLRGGESREIVLNWTPSPQIGEHVKRASIITNDSRHPLLAITLVARLEAHCIVDPSPVVLHVNRDRLVDDPPHTQVRIRARNPANAFRVESVRAPLRSRLDVKGPTREQTATGEVDVIDIGLEEGFVPDATQVDLVVSLTDTATRLIIPVYIRVFGRVSATPPIVNVACWRPSSTDRKIWLESLDSKSLHVTKLDASRVGSVVVEALQESRTKVQLIVHGIDANELTSESALLVHCLVDEEALMLTLPVRRFGKCPKGSE